MHTQFRLTRVTRRTAGLVLAVVILAVPAVALANDYFPDVLNSNPFHDDINAMLTPA